MDPKQYKLCLDTLGKLKEVGVLSEVILIGSWCVEFYDDYFSGLNKTVLYTRDIDLLVPFPHKVNGS